MDIIIVGCGTVGSAICSQLSHEGHNITVVDSDAVALAELCNTYDVYGVDGSGASISVLRKAGADKAYLLIAVTSSDEINILCCSVARKLGTHHTIARVRNPEYSELMQLMKSEMNLSLTINPEFYAASEIYRMLRFPSAAKLETFCRGRVELAEFAIGPDSSFIGRTLHELRSSLNMNFLVCCVLRGSDVIIPSGDGRSSPPPLSRRTRRSAAISPAPSTALSSATTARSRRSCSKRGSSGLTRSSPSPIRTRRTR